MLGLMLMLAAVPDSLSSVELKDASTGVLARFESCDRAVAGKIVGAVERKVTVFFFKARSSCLAALYFGQAESLQAGALLELAKWLSSRTGVASAHAFIHPGVYDKLPFEAEGFWSFIRGLPTESRVLEFADDDNYLKWKRRRLGFADYQLTKWPKYPLSQLAEKLAIPGRSFFEIKRGLFSPAQHPWPEDCGENVVYAGVYLPDRMALEIRQGAETQKVSTSKVMQAALEQAAKSHALTLAVERAAPGDEARSGYRLLPFYIDEKAFGPVDTAMQSASLDLGEIFRRAWRRTHPYQTAESSTAAKATDKTSDGDAE